MRDIAHIWEAWSTDIPKVGEFKPCSRVTVEKSFWLNVTASRTVGTWTRGPARWYQRFDTNDQVETEIPNIKNVSIERSIESDAGQCTIVLANTAELAWGELEETPGQHGRPGFYTWSRGVSQDAVSRWGHVINEWRDVLVPNALLRTYQGYGGHDKNLFDAVSDGNVVLTGVWMVDTVSTGTSGDLTLQCRDVAKLLLDQMLFPPLVPMAEYPLLYQRYTYEYFQIPPEPAPGIEHEIITRSTASLDGLGDYVDGPDFTVRASSDPDGANAVVFGHRPADALDLSFDPPGSDGTFAHQWTYWLSNGYGDRNGFPWIEANAQNTEVNLVMFHPWAGNYLVYVSVWEGGGWVAPEDSGQGGIIPTDDPAAAIPYVTSFGANWEGGEPPGQFNNRYPLPRTYQAAKIRVTLTNLVASQEGGFRGGIRKLAPEYDYTAAHYPSLVFTCCPHPNTAGYWQCRSDGRHYAFGEARVGALSPTNPVQTQSGYVMAINANRDGTGYWTVDNFGRILAFGAAEWLGDMSGSGRGDIVDFAPTPMGLGYWILCRDGSVHPCGEADNHGFDLVTGLMPSGSPIQARAIESHPFDYGYWILWSDGTVHSHDLTYYGHANRVGFGLTEYVGKLRRTKTGNGYMINSGGGLMQYFGDACHSGNGIRRDVSDWVKGLCWDFTPDWEAAPGVAGVAVQHADGTLDYLGNFPPFGSIASGQGTLRKAGNYADYCLDEETEILTPTGWRRWDQLEIGDQILGVNPDTDESCWQPVESIYRRKCVDRDMVKMHGASFDALTTPEHRWLTRTASNLDRWRWTTSDALRTTDLIPMSIPSSGTHCPVAPTHKDEFVELVAWFWTEGWWTPTSAAVGQSSTVNPQYVERIRHILRSQFGESGLIARGPTRSVAPKALWRESTRTDGLVTFSLSKPIGDRLRAVMSQRKAVHWEFLRQLTSEQLDLFVETSIDADGWRNADGTAKALTQTNLDRIESFEFACILAGRPVTRKKTPQRDSWCVHLHKHGYQAPIRSAWKKGRMTVTRERYSGVVWCPTVEHHNFIARRNGAIYLTGNSDIVRELLLWSGFYWMRDPQPNELPDVYANVETTGAFAVEDLPAEMFDKKSVMDAIHALKEIVGYITFVDDEGAFRFESPNWWSKGNYDFEGHQLDLMPEIDEKVQLFDYTIQFHDSEARSEIIVASENPYPMVHGADAPTGVATSRYVPPSAPDLKGMIKPAMWTNGVFVDDKEQMMMAQLIAMHIWFARRTGDVTCLANPLIGPNDQVQIYERRTGEVYVHYVRGTRINHDLETGDFEQTLTTHWLGGTPVNTSPFLFSCATRPQYDGYWQVNAAGGVFAFGAAETYLPNRKSENFEAILTIRSTPTGLGYYTLGGGGEIIPYGDAVHYGMIINRKLNTKDMALTPSGNGYWVLTADGHVQAHGDAIWRGDAEVSGEMPSEAPIQAESIEAHPNGAGYWILRSDGLVTGHGIADYGSANRDGYNPTEYTSCLRCTPDGGGYYIPSGDGLIQVFGNAVHYGNGIHRPRINDFFGIVWDMMVVNGGYALQHADGLLDTMGAFVDHGSVMATTDPSNWVIDDPDSGSTDPNVLHISDQLRGYTKRIESKSTSDSAFLAGEAPLTEKARP